MYDKHQPIISGWARSCPKNLAKVIAFAIVSARMQFSNVGPKLREIEREGLAGTSGLSHIKFNALVRLRDSEGQIYTDCEALYRAGDITGLVTRLYHVYGLGMAKAGFVAQLVYGVSGCLDSHNLERFGITHRRFQSRTYDGERMATARRRVAFYNRTCSRWGGTAKLWDTWCDYMARQYPEDYANASEVSALHVTAIGIS